MTTSLLRGAAAAMLALLVAVAPAAVATAVPVDAASASAVPAPVALVPAGVDDFTFQSFDADYELGRGEGGRSVLDTTETLVALFPEFDQNRGIRRAIPLDYDGHPVDVQVQSVTDAAGQPRAFDTEEDDDGEFLLVTIAGSDYVHGEQTYVISYRQHNVTLQPDDAAIDEFYWDVNGTGWAQPFGVVRAELRVDAALAAAFAGDAACYRGGAGAGTPCETLQVGETDEQPLLVAQSTGIGPYENLTISVAFEPGTFVPRDEAFASSPAAITSAVCAFIAFVLFVLALVLRLTRWRSAPRGTIIAQYEPPEGVSALTAADLVGQPSRGVTATILERAVAGEVRIVDRGGTQYSVQFTGGPLGDLDAQSVVRALFSDHPTIGQERSLSSKSTTLGQRLLSIRKAVASRAVSSGLRRSPALGGRILIAVFAFAAAVLGFIAAVVALEQVMGGLWPLLALIAGVLFALAAGVAVAGVRPLTVEGRRVRDHLEGLRLFIRLAEADRIRMLQSPSGALRDPLRGPVPTSTDAATTAAASVTATDPAEVLRLTERLLPYAALFGLEKQWLRELASLYEVSGREPGWYAGTSAFDAARFSVAVSSFTTTSTTSWSGSSSSSSSSGSGGGGSSGGGGGGGGGGGV
ncbi:DUF2207 domain-containing protein [Agromyces sp. Leaf222]|uniref:DUF2207 domain-containing protein n=1 Tax=Agromyces sp. Leaf222 TaxID=1735688 RepID=UPI0006F70B65|nr:DUF2207 domain-containing protein [Agromyces sp. Leaf222]KQM83969.1 hypothetical protein ASE68_12785 [Agromyces sp. Leaf222]